MKRIITLFGGLLLTAVICLAQGKWEQASVTPYGTGGINSNRERIDNSYNAGKFNSEVKSTSKNDPYVYFRKGQFSVPARTYQPGASVPVSISLTVKRHSGKGTPKGNAGAVIVNGKAGQGTSVPNAVSISGKDAAKSGNVTLTVPTHSAAGNNFSIVYSCFDIKVVYLYRWVEDKPVVEQPVVVDEPVQTGEVESTDVIVLPDDTILPPADSTAAFEGFPEEVDSLTLLMEQGINPFEEEPEPEESPVEEPAEKAAKAADSEVFLSILGFDLTKKDTIVYGIIAGLGLLVLILLLILIFRKNPAKKAAKEEARKAAAEAKAAAKAEAAEKAAAAKAERDAKLAEAKAAAAEKAAAAKAAQEAKRAELQAAQEAKRAELKAAQEAKAAELKAKREAALAAKAAATAAAAAKAEAPKPEEKPAEKPVGKKFCENCGAPLDPDAVFCENCGTKVQ